MVISRRLNQINRCWDVILWAQKPQPKVGWKFEVRREVATVESRYKAVNLVSFKSSLSPLTFTEQRMSIESATRRRDDPFTCGKTLFSTDKWRRSLAPTYLKDVDHLHVSCFHNMEV